MDGEYSTHDLYTMVVLHYEGYAPDKVTVNEKSQVIFTYIDPAVYEKVKGWLLDRVYARNEYKVEPHKFMSSYRAVKIIIKESKQ